MTLEDIRALLEIAAEVPYNVEMKDGQVCETPLCVLLDRKPMTAKKWDRINLG